MGERSAYQNALRNAGGTDPALVRTITPIIVGAIAAWLLSNYGITLPGEPATEAVAAIISALYYTVVHFWEKYVPGAARLLGSTRQPVVYDKPAPRRAVSAGEGGAYK